MGDMPRTAAVLLPVSCTYRRPAVERMGKEHAGSDRKHREPNRSTWVSVVVVKGRGGEGWKTRVS